MADQPPWWDEPGAGECVVCERRFHYEAGYVCAHCDQPLCPVCVRYERRHDEVICQHCEET